MLMVNVSNWKIHYRFYFYSIILQYKYYYLCLKIDFFSRLSYHFKIEGRLLDNIALFFETTHFSAPNRSIA